MFVHSSAKTVCVHKDNRLFAWCTPSMKVKCAREIAFHAEKLVKIDLKTSLRILEEITCFQKSNESL